MEDFYKEQAKILLSEMIQKVWSQKKAERLVKNIIDRSASEVNRRKN